MESMQMLEPSRHPLFLLNLVRVWEQTTESIVVLWRRMHIKPTSPRRYCNGADNNQDTVQTFDSREAASSAPIRKVIDCRIPRYGFFGNDDFIPGKSCIPVVDVVSEIIQYQYPTREVLIRWSCTGKILIGIKTCLFCSLARARHAFQGGI